MTYDPKRHHRRSVRLEGYDYSQPGGYFVTICAHKRECVFGQIVGHEMRLSTIGKVVQEEWLRTPTMRPNAELGQFVVMPNHVHGIIILHDTVGAYRDTPLRERPFRSPSGTIGAIVRGFKSASAKRINHIRNTPGAPLWQRGFYEHIIRTEADLRRIQEYILNNPLQWALDDENPRNPGTTRPEAKMH